MKFLDNGQIMALGAVALLAGAATLRQRGSLAQFGFDNPSAAGLQLGADHTSRGGEALANWRWHGNPGYKDDPGSARSGPRGATRKSNRKSRR